MTTNKILLQKKLQILFQMWFPRIAFNNEFCIDLRLYIIYGVPWTFSYMKSGNIISEDRYREKYKISFFYLVSLEILFVILKNHSYHFFQKPFFRYFPIKSTFLIEFLEFAAMTVATWRDVKTCFQIIDQDRSSMKYFSLYHSICILLKFRKCYRNFRRTFLVRLPLHVSEKLKS